MLGRSMRRWLVVMVLAGVAARLSNPSSLSSSWGSRWLFRGGSIKSSSRISGGISSLLLTRKLGKGHSLESSPRDSASSLPSRKRTLHSIGLPFWGGGREGQQKTSHESFPGPHLHGEDSESQNEIVYGTDLSQANKDLIFDGLRNIYKNKVLPLEIASKYSQFGSPPLSPSDFEAKPVVLVLGQYSVGKTSFIRSLLKRDFPGQRIGPEPTTDRFTAIMHSPKLSTSRNGNGSGDRLIPGHALVMQSEKGFQGLASFGNDFLSKFEGVEVGADILRNITIIDTPGVLSGEKQRIGRDYNYAEVVKWFAERSDMIIVMFDAHKLDISDELKAVLDILKPHHEKIRILLNKADSVNSQSLLRVYGALMWSLGKVVKIPEASRVFMGSFWDAPTKKEGRDNIQLLNREKADLMAQMNMLPRQAAVRRINELIKRSRSVKVHAYIIHYLRKQMPYFWGQKDEQERLMGRLDKEFIACARRYNLPLGDFPSIESYRSMLAEVKNFVTEFKRLDKTMIREMDKVMTIDIPKLLEAATSQVSMSAPNPQNQKPLNINQMSNQTQQTF